MCQFENCFLILVNVSKKKKRHGSSIRWINELYLLLLFCGYFINRNYNEYLIFSTNLNLLKNITKYRSDSITYIMVASGN